MNLMLESELFDDFLLMKATGEIISLDEWKILIELYFRDIEKYCADTIIIDETSLHWPKELIEQTDLEKLYNEELPPEVNDLKIALAIDEKYKTIVNFWEKYSEEKGINYKAFTCVESAHEFVCG